MRSRLCFTKTVLIVLVGLALQPEIESADASRRCNPNSVAADLVHESMLLDRATKKFEPADNGSPCRTRGSGTRFAEDVML